MRGESTTPVVQIPSLTPLRGIAALFVVAFHLHFFVPNLHYAATVPAFLLGYLWVDFFFLLSGFIIAHVYGGSLQNGLHGFRYGAFLYTRWTRIYPLHFAVVVAFVGFELVQVALHHGWELLPDFRAFSGSHTVGGIFSALFLVEAIGLHDRLMWNYASWSISAEFVAYLAFPLLYVALRRRSAAISWLAFSLLLFVLNLLALTNGGRLALHNDWGWARCLLEFSIGILVYEAYESGRLKQWLAKDALFLVVLGLILVGMMTYVRDVLLVPAFAILVLAAACNDGAVSRVLASRPLTHLGEISYSIYMMNVLLFQMVHVAWALAFGTSFGRSFSMAQAWLAWLLAMVLVIAVSTWTHRAIEVPARSWLRKQRPFGQRSRRAIEARLPLSTGTPTP